MAWESAPTTDVGVAQGTNSTTTTLNPGEGCTVGFDRTDLGSTDDTHIGYHRSADGILWDVDPNWRRRVQDAQFPFSITIRQAVRYFRFSIANASGGGDTITVDVAVLKDGINL